MFNPERPCGMDIIVGPYVFGTTTKLLLVFPGVPRGRITWPSRFPAIGFIEIACTFNHKIRVHGVIGVLAVTLTHLLRREYARAG